MSDNTFVGNGYSEPYKAFREYSNENLDNDSREDFWPAYHAAWQHQQAKIDSLQQEAKSLNATVNGLNAARYAYASEFKPDAEGDPDVGSIHENIRKLKTELDKARQPVSDEQIDQIMNECAENLHGYKSENEAIKTIRSILERK